MNDRPDKRWRPTPTRPIEIDFVDPNMSADALVARRAIISLQMGDIADSIASIKTQIENSEAAESKLGVYRDAEWVRRVHAAQRHYGRQYAEHARAIDNISRRIAHLETVQTSREAAFLAAAEELLPTVSLREIWRRVEAGADSGFIGVASFQAHDIYITNQ
jgi:hypothetical protein